MENTKKKYIIRSLLGVGLLLLVVFLQQIFPVHLLDPLSHKPLPVMSIVIPRLESIPNTFHLTREPSFVAKAHAQEDYDSASSYIVINYDTGKVLAEKNAAAKVPIASLTKIMTSVVSLDIAPPSSMFAVSSYASQIEPTKIGVTPGESLSLDELLHAGLMTSANDAIQVIAEGINHMVGGDVFIQAMNEKAKYLGLIHTSFTNPQGFDNPDHGSSAEDLAVLSEYAMTHYPLVADIAKTDYLHLPATSTHKQYDLYNWNGLLDVYPGIFGLKIGNTDAAQTTMVVGATRNGERVLVVLLGAPDILHRDLWASELLDLGFANEGNLPPVNITSAQLYAKYATWKYWQ
jgi:D-alanyl-D-alanine carboxypeptidase (penicillin-binding protein 5/6)